MSEACEADKKRDDASLIELAEATRKGAAHTGGPRLQEADEQHGVA